MSNKFDVRNVCFTLNLTDIILTKLTICHFVLPSENHALEISSKPWILCKFTSLLCHVHGHMVVYDARNWLTDSYVSFMLISMPKGRMVLGQRNLYMLITNSR